MAAWHGNNCTGGVEEIFAAYWAVAIRGTLKTLVRASMRYGNANIATLAMEIVPADTFSLSTDAAVNAMVYFLTTIIVPKFTDVAIVPSCYSSTLDAVFTSFLRSSAGHAQHIPRSRTLQIVILHSIVAVPTCIPSATVKTLDLDIALVVLTAERRPVFQCVQILFAKIIHALIECTCSVRWIRVSRAQIEGVIRVYIRSKRRWRRCVYFGEDGLPRSGRERPIVGYEAVRRLWAEKIITFGH